MDQVLIIVDEKDRNFNVMKYERSAQTFPFALEDV